MEISFCENERKKIRRVEKPQSNKVRGLSLISSFYSLVIELVDNAIDSGARNIDVVLSNDFSFVEIIDDGSGISVENMEKLGQWNFTSKYDDDFVVGRKGEGLASISAIAALCIVSKERDSPIWYKFCARSNKIRPVLPPVTLRSGTIVSVSDIFSCFPVRKSSMNLSKEISCIREHLKLKSLLHFNISFSMSFHGSLQSSFRLVSKNSLEDRIVQIFGGDIFSKLKFVSVNYELFQLRGFISPPSKDCCFRKKAFQALFLNNHLLCRENQISREINSEYFRLLSKSMGGPQPRHFDSSDISFNYFPGFILQIQCPKCKYDIFIEPSKDQAIFRDSSVVSHLVCLALEKIGFIKSKQEKCLELENKKSLSLVGGTSLFPFLKDCEEITSSIPNDNCLDVSNENLEANGLPLLSLKSLIPEFSVSMRRKSRAFNQNTSLKRSFLLLVENNRIVSLHESVSKATLKSISCIGQWDNKFLICTSNSGSIYCLDQHACDERILLEQLQCSFYQNPLQTYDVCHIVVFDRDQDVLSKVTRILSQWGIIVVPDERFERGSRIKIIKLPIVFGVKMILDDVTEFLEYIYENISLPSASLKPPSFHRIISSLSCKKAIKFGDVISKEKASKILMHLCETKIPFQCAHGRPTVAPLAKISTNEPNSWSDIRFCNLFP